ncbi:MAG: hypothetical protein HZC16_02695 [Candidatus Omnitrophica bacterium]|nr:hypothetical protein [Candidatus Omnitrophota bacterium]
MSVFQGVKIADTAKIYGKTSIGEGSEVMDFAIIGAKSRANTGNGAKIGKNSIIRNSAVIYEDALIGDEFQCGDFAHIREKVVIGKGVKLGCFSTAEWSNKIGDYCNIQGQSNLGECSTLEEGVFVGAGVIFAADSKIDGTSAGPYLEKGCRIGTAVTTVGNIRIGACSVIGAHAVVTRDIPPFSLAYGIPAKVHRQVTKEEIQTYQKNILKNNVDLLSLL